MLTPAIIGDVDMLARNPDFGIGAIAAALTKMEARHPEYPHVLGTRLAGKILSEAKRPEVVA
jgi:hypothetical protein